MQFTRRTFNSLVSVCRGGEITTRWAHLHPLACPLFGLALGFVLVIVNRLFEPHLHTEILALVLILILILATGGHHLAGVQEAFDDLSKPNGALNTDRPRRIGGLIAVLMVVLFKLSALQVIGESRGFGLLLTPLLARWSLTLFLFGSTGAADDGARRIAQNVRPWHLIVVTTLTLSLALLIADRKALWTALFLSLFALVARGYLHRRRGGISVASCGAVIEVGEALSFTLFTIL